MATVWEEFGVAVAKARAAKKWTLEAVADVSFGNKDRKGYVSQIEKGRTALNKTTVEKLAKALDLTDAVTDPLYRAHLPEENKLDTDARRLMTMASADKTAPVAADALMIGLAYEYAQGSHIDLQTAYAGLKGALQAAADMRAELDRLHNMDDRLTAVLRRVADLNDQGLRKEAGEALDAAIKAKEAELEALQDAALKQDRLLNRPAEAAQRLIARLRASAPAGGLFAATHNLIVETRKRGEQNVDPFDLSLALELAKANHGRAKGAHLPTSLNDLGNCYGALGERRGSVRQLTLARRVHADALRLMSRQLDPRNWAVSQDNLGNALSILGNRTADQALLKQAIAAHRAALSVFSPEATPIDWARCQNNLGTALQALGEFTADGNLLEQAISAHRAALTVRSPDATPKEWANSQNNLGAALRKLNEKNSETALLEQAIAAHCAALTVRTPDDMPMDWAHSQHNLAIAYMSLHSIKGSQEWLDKAEECFTNALTVRLRDYAKFLWADSHGGLGRVSFERFKLTGDKTHLDLAKARLIEARSVYALDPENVTLADFDRYLAEIDAA
jgi:tetratricopeptide (TPR) repeat protein/transcriptional regulator with XRE-family HTH domain